MSGLKPKSDGILPVQKPLPQFDQIVGLDEQTGRRIGGPLVVECSS